MTTPLAQIGTGSLTHGVAEEIRAVMARRKITGAQMAKALGVSAAWVSYRVNGSVSPSVADLERIAGFLGVTIVDLFPRNRRQVTVTYRDESIYDSTRPIGRRDSTGPGRAKRVNMPMAA